VADAQTDFTKSLPEKIQADPEKFKTAGCIFLFKITGEGGGTWTLDLKGDDVGVKDGEVGTPDCSIEVSAEDWKSMSDSAFANAMPLFFQGKLKVAGNAMLATKLQQLFA
jgi:putative sterol carrier protein